MKDTIKLLFGCALFLAGFSVIQAVTAQGWSNEATQHFVGGVFMALIFGTWLLILRYLEKTKKTSEPKEQEAAKSEKKNEWQR